MKEAFFIMLGLNSSFSAAILEKKNTTLVIIKSMEIHNSLSERQTTQLLPFC